MALTKITFLVAGDHLACEDIGPRVLEHLGIDSCMLLERNRVILDGTDCAKVSKPSFDVATGALGLLTLARSKLKHAGITTESDQHAKSGRKYSEDDPSRPREDNFAQQQNVDPFPDPNLIGTGEHDPRESEMTQHLHDMVERAKYNGLPK